MQNKLLLILFLISSINLFSQKADSLINILPTIKNDSVYAITLLKIADDFYNSNPDTAKHFSLKAQKIGNNIKNQYIIAKSLYSLGRVNSVIGKSNIAKINFKNAIKISEKLDFKIIIATSLIEIGNLYLNKGDDANAILFYHKSLKISKSINDKTIISDCYNNIAIVLENQDNYDEALKYYKKALILSKNNKNEVAISTHYQNISGVFFNQNKLDSAFYFLNLALKIKEKTNDIDGLALINNNIGFLYQTLNQPDSAYKYYLKSATLYKKIDNKSRLASPLRHLAGIYENEFYNYNKAEKFYKEAEQYATETSASKYLIKIYGDLGKLYIKKKQYKLSTYYLQKRNTLYDSIYNIERDEKITEIQTKYETAKKDKEIAVKNAKLKEKELIVKNQKSILYISFFVIFILIAFSLFYYFQRNKINKLYKKLVEQNIKEIEDEERKNDIVKTKQTKEDKKEQYELLTDKVLELFEKNKVYKNNNLTTVSLAKKLKTNKTYLSRAINIKFNKNFNAFLNEYRIKKAIKLILTDEYSKYTISYISDEVGFNSMSVFISYFKKVTGVTPSVFIKSSKEIKKETKKHKSTYKEL